MNLPLPSTFRSTALSGLFLLFGANTAMGQSKAQVCVFSEDLEDGTPPVGWDLGPQVQRLDTSAEFVDAWRVGTAAEANAHGFFPVPNEPINGRFIMANDDAFPCDCAMNDVSLTTPVLDLSAITGAVLECRVYHDQRFGGGAAIIETSNDGLTWDTVLTIAPVQDEWQDLFVDISALSGSSTARIRFRWNDGGGWATGFALDDVCVRARFANDLSVMTVQAHDPMTSPFNTGERTLRYTAIPVEQVAPITVTAEVRNSGTVILRNIAVSASITHAGQDFGPFTGDLVDSLLPGARALVRIPTGWTPNALGEVDLFIQSEADGVDEDINDNSGQAMIYITGPGWEHRYGAMAMLAGTSEGRLGGEEEFVACGRMELLNTPMVPAGISAVLGNGTSVGAQVRGILFDQNLSFIDTTARHTINEEDLEALGAGIPLYLALTNGVALAGDHFAGIQYLGQGGSLYIATSGNNDPGASLLMQGSTFEVEYTRETPMVRLHFSAYGVGLNGPDADQARMQLFPSPTSDHLFFTLPHEPGTRMEIQVLDVTGREWLRTNASGTGSVTSPGSLSTATLPNGTYLLTLTTDGTRWTERFMVVH